LPLRSKLLLVQNVTKMRASHHEAYTVLIHVVGVNVVWRNFVEWKDALAADWPFRLKHHIAKEKRCQALRYIATLALMPRCTVSVAKSVSFAT